MPSEIALLIQQLRAADRKHRVFGSESHQYKLRPTLNEATLRAFETRHDLQLPADYRAFLLEVGDGGTGPYYGLDRLEEAAAHRDLSLPFPLTEASPLDEDDIDAVGDEEQPGVLALCHHGCAIYSFLVVRGPAYGTIWNGECELFVPTNLTFGNWFRHWAQRALHILENEKLIRLIRVGMTRTKVIKLTGDLWRDREFSYDGVTRYYLESSDIPAQLEMDKNARVMKINPWPFI